MSKPRSRRRGTQDRRSPASQSQLASAPAAATARSRGPLLWISLGLIITNIVVYAAVRRHDFVYYDDQSYVTENGMVAAGLTWSGVLWAFTTGHAANWHPLTWLSHMLDVQLYGMQAGGHHLTNLVLHVLNTLLLFGVLHRMTGAVGRSGFVAALFAVHPLHVESVAWVAERKDVLSTLFWMLTLWTYVSYVRRPKWNRYVVVVVCFALGLLAKPMLVTLPCVLLLLDYWPLGRATLGPATGRDRGVRRASQQRGVWLHLLREKTPLLGLAAASSVVTFIVQQRGGSVVPFERAPLDLRVENALVSYVTYIGKMLWPAGLAAFYPLTASIPRWQVIGAALVLIGACAIAVRAAGSRPYVFVGWLWYVGTLVPVIGLVQVGNQRMADRYTYVPLIGLFLIVAWGVPDVLRGWRHRRIALTAGAGIVLAASAITARAQVRTWENSLAVWQLPDSPGRAKDFSVTLNRVVASNRLQEGDALSRAGKIDEAIARYSEALRLRPDFEEAHNSLGIALIRQGRQSEAIAQFAEAARLRPDYADARHNLALALAQQGRLDEAIPEMLQAVRINPKQPLWHFQLAGFYQRKGDTTQAIYHLERTLTLDPNDRAARRALDELKPPGPQ